MISESGEQHDDCKIPAVKPVNRVTHNDVQMAENALDAEFMGVVGCGDEFHAVYWPMDKWIDDRSTVDMLSTVVSTYPGLNWNNPLPVQFCAMLSVVQNVDWINELRNGYALEMVDFMRIVFTNWPELFSKKKYASALSTAIVSAFTEKGEL